MRTFEDRRCRDLSGDRRTGQSWQDRFCRMSERHGCVCEDKQKSKDVAAVASFEGRKLILPDIQLCKNGVTVLPEIKHKSPTNHGQYGWEEYRLSDCVEYARQSGLQVIMAIHDWSLAGSKENEINDISHWRWADVIEMDRQFDYRNPEGKTWRAGKPCTTPVLYWNTSRFLPLLTHPFFVDGEKDRKPSPRRDPSRPSSRQTTFVFDR